MESSDKERAKQIIVEIIRQADGEFHNKTNMYKAFWKAHLEFARNNPGYMSLWPIVKMPNGPGIHNFDHLIAELVSEDILEIDQVEKGDFKAFRFKLINQNEPSKLAPEYQQAIREGVDFVIGRTAADVSTESHFESRSWNEAESNGDELNIYVDLLPEEEYEAKKDKMKKMLAAFDKE